MLTLLVMTGKLTPGTIEFNFALAATLASVIITLAIVLIELILYALGLSPLLLLFYLVDALVELFGVKGLTARLTEWLAQWLYVVETSITQSASDQADSTSRSPAWR
ncbi:MAG: hypothetical protein M9928_23385 [Anaerolineae bacterium]|nr:hypothetical protein [Anaerolineae bacterium]